MDIEQIREAKTKSEQLIAEVLKVFKETTGMTITGCDIRTYEINTITGVHKLVPITAVRLKIEDI